MNDLKVTVDDYLQQLKDPNCKIETPFRSLIQLDHSIIPWLIDAFEIEEDQRLRAILIQIIWEHRQSEIIPFLMRVLGDNNSDVWKNALDGLVTIGSIEVVDELQLFKQRCDKAQQNRIDWIDEAIGQILESIEGNSRKLKGKGLNA